MKKIFIFLTILSLTTLLLLIIAIFSLPQKNKTVVFPSPSGVNVIPSPKTPEKGFALPNSFSKRDASRANYSNIPILIGKLIEKLPYNGSLFSLSYNYNKDGFNLILNKNNIAEAENEYESFLKNNAILDKNWLKNVVVGYK